MVIERLCEKGRLVFFFASPRHLEFFNCKTETSKCFLMKGSKTLSCHSRFCKQIDTLLALKKLETARQCCEKIETVRHAYITRLQDP